MNEKQQEQALDLIKTLVAELWGAYEKDGGIRQKGEPDPYYTNEYHFRDAKEGNPAWAVNKAEKLFESLGMDMWEEM